MSKQPFSSDWQSGQNKRANKAILASCLILVGMPVVFLFFAVVLAATFGEENTGNNREVERIQKQLTMTSTPAAEGLDLQAVLAAFKDAPSAEEAARAEADASDPATSGCGGFSWSKLTAQ